MGGGKSRVIVDYIQTMAPLKPSPHPPGDPYRVLLICPNKAVINVWPTELLKWSHPDFHYLLLPLAEIPIPYRAAHITRMLADTQPTTAQIVILNYEAAPRTPLSSLLLKTPWDLIIMDECHRIKAPGGQQSRYMQRLCAKAPKVVGLSGTPMPQGPIDIYAQARAIAPTIWGTSLQRFRDAYCIMGPSGTNKATGKPYPAFLAHTIQGYRNMDDFHAKLASWVFHVEPAVVEAGLPDYTDVTRHTPLPHAAQSAYDELEREMCAELDDKFVTVDNALTKQLRLAQLTAGHWLDPDTGKTNQVHTAKLDAAMEIIEDAAPTERLVIFARFRPELADYRDAILRTTNRKPCMLMGGTDELPLWKQTPGGILIVQIAAGAEAVSFVEARYQIYSTVTWSYSQYEQSRRRIRRHGQTRPVTYYHLIAPGTVDEDAHSALASKGNVIEEVRRGIRQRQGRTHPA